MTQRKKLIEVALPLEAIDEASVREKYIRKGHPSTLHQWWARRPLAACRAVLFASLVVDPNDPVAPSEFVELCKQLPRKRNASENDTPRRRLFDFIEDLVLWESTSDRKVLEKARELIKASNRGKLPRIVDPFAGGGSIPLEAQRLGLNATGSDLNPIPVLLNKALIEIPPQFAGRQPVNPQVKRERIDSIWLGTQGMAADVRYYGRWMQDQAWEKIGHLYPLGPDGETVQAWRWMRTVQSPNPAISIHVPLVRSFSLCKKKGSRYWVEPQINKHTNTIRYQIKSGKGTVPSGTMRRNGGLCLISESPIPYEYCSFAFFRTS